MDSRQANAVNKFQEYLQIKTVHPSPDYTAALVFLEKYAKELGLPTKVVKTGKDEALIMTWEGRNPHLKSIMLNSHTDVVPVYPDEWKYDAFAAVKDDKGDIYARGTQDMKSVGIQYLEAIRVLKVTKKMSFDRTIHITFMPNEEVGGHNGMEEFAHSAELKEMNVGFILDEGLAHPDNKYSVFYGERSTWWISICCRGNPGHGSRFIKNTAAEKLQSIINSFMDFRKSEEAKLEEGRCMFLGDVTTTNLTMLKGGIQHNVVPNEFTVGFDIRISKDVNLVEFEKKIQGWIAKAGTDITYKFIQKCNNAELTSTNKSDPWWKAFSGTFERLNTELVLEIFPAGTDSRYLRATGYPAIGFSPIKNTPILLHDHNEFLNENVFLEGIDVYGDLITALASVPSY